MKYCYRNWKKTSGTWCLALVFGLLLLACTAATAGEMPSCPEFIKISDGGFGDPQNNYAWSVSEFKGDLYVGTGRNVPYMVSLAMKKQGIFPENMTISALTHPRGAAPPPLVLPNQSPPSREDVITWSNDMRPEIWRYHEGSWSQVHQASTFINPLNGYTYPEGIGYRIMTTFNDTGGTDALYAGVGFGFGRILIVKSTDGVTWVPVNTSSIPSRDTRAMVSHDGKLYVGTGDGIFATGSPSPYADTWVKVADFQVASLKSFNGYLYAGTGNPTGPSETDGFEVWRSTVASPTSPGDWTRVVSGGAGDAWNVLAASMQDYKGDLYIGSMNLPFATGTEGIKGFDLIRLNTGDSWDLIVGNYHPKVPTVPRGPPLSGWPSGYANPFNLYAWSIGEYKGDLYLGTFDIFSFARFIGEIPGGNDMLIEAVASQESVDPANLPEGAGAFMSELGELGQVGPVNGNGTFIIPLIEHLGRELGGADLWTSRDGVYWVPLELNGFGDPNNYGFRTMITTPGGFIIGTANPFTGCQVWRGTTPDTPPASVTGLHNVSYQPYSITWNWTDPGSADFDHVMVFLDGEFKENVTKGTQTYTATWLSPGTAYTIGTKTVGTTGLINHTWVRSTACTRSQGPEVKAWKFRSDLNNSGVYDDGGSRPLGAFKWSYTTGSHVESSPAVANGVVYIGSNDNNVYALDAATGALKWSYTTWGSVSSSPAVTDGVVYVGSNDNRVYALDAETGALKWSYTTGGSVFPGPAVEKGVVYVGSNDNRVYALDAATGALIWSYATGYLVDSSPAVANGVVYIGSNDNNVYALDAVTGALKWGFATGASVHSSPAVTDGVVYVGSNDNRVYALDAATGALKWSYTTGGWVHSSPAVADGIVYAGSKDNNVYALDAATGALRWSYTTGGWVYPSPAVANGLLYAGSWDNKVYALDAKTGEFQWSYKTGDILSSSPAVANGLLYFGSDDNNVYALGSSPEDFPGSITNLHNTTYQPTSITWTWTDPGSANFDHVMVFFDGEFKENVAKGLQSWTAPLLAPGTEHTIGTRTVGTTGQVNQTWVNSTVRTAPVIIIPPVAGFNANITSGLSPLPVGFTDTSTGSLPLTYQWNFGDGSVNSTEKDPQHTFSTSINQTFIVTLTVSNGAGSNSTSTPITVNILPKPEFLADFTVSPVTGIAPLTVRCIDQSIGNPTRFIYEFGDGVSVMGPNPIHTYRYPGVYTITLTIMKYDPATKSMISSVTKKPNAVTVNRFPFIPPVAGFDAMPVTGAAPLTVFFTDQSTGFPTYFNYDFGDGMNTTGNRNPVHMYRLPGVYTVTQSVMKYDRNSGSMISDVSVRKDLVVVY